MISLESTITHDSSVMPGVQFVVTVANQMHRARMESRIVDSYVELQGHQQTVQDTLLSEPLFNQAKALLDELAPVLTNGNKPLLDRAEQIISKLESIKLEGREYRDANTRLNLVLEATIKPAVIDSALVSISGLMIDGNEITTPDDVAKLAPVDLVDEIFQACQSAAGLTVEQRKNLQSPGGSARQTEAPTSDMTVEAASGKDSTKSAIVASTSRTT